MLNLQLNENLRPFWPRLRFVGHSGPGPSRVTLNLLYPASGFPRSPLAFFFISIRIYVRSRTPNQTPWPSATFPPGLFVQTLRPCLLPSPRLLLQLLSIDKTSPSHFLKSITINHSVRHSFIPLFYISSIHIHNLFSVNKHDPQLIVILQHYGTCSSTSINILH